jgi:thymidine kinase
MAADDIVVTLRARAFERQSFGIADTLLAAADEIERLRVRVALSDAERARRDAETADGC